MIDLSVLQEDRTNSRLTIVDGVDFFIEVLDTAMDKAHFIPSLTENYNTTKNILKDIRVRTFSKIYASTTKVA